MGQPTGQVVARPMVARACGHMCEFQHYAVDRYRAQRLAKFQSTRCPECVAQLDAEHRKAIAELPGKGEAIRALPAGATMTMARKEENVWSGTLTADGTTVEGSSDGPQGLVVTLARAWAAAKGMKATPPAEKPAAAAPPPKPAAGPPRPAPTTIARPRAGGGMDRTR